MLTGGHRVDIVISRMLLQEETKAEIEIESIHFSIVRREQECVEVGR